MRTIRVIRQLLITHFQELSEYRGDVFIYILSSLMLPIVLMNVWLAVAESRDLPFIEKKYLIQYFFIQMILASFISAWHGYFVGEDIKNGKISQYIIKPISYFLFQLTENISEKMWKIILSFPVIFIVYILYGEYLTFSFTLSTLPFIIIAVVASFLINFLLEHLVGMSAFWFSSTRSIDNYNDILLFLTSGKLYPLHYIKDAFFISIINILPYKYIIGFPIDVILGKLSFIDMLKGSAIQISWVVVLFIASTIIWKKGLKIYSAYGA